MSDDLPLFLYGSLMPGQGNGWRVQAHGGFRGDPLPARVEGRLLDFGRWPGMVPGAGEVKGVLVWMHDLAAALPELDHYEGYRGPGEENLFERRRVEARTDAGPVWAWAWWFVAGDAGPGRRGQGRTGSPVPGGDWAAWRAGRDGP
ncbi:MAG: gamma-glutamylcyclotransferase [Alphaproteobacteria bacterium]|nr:gamma-glutamylcyclotransferase [Alphaproteobacteria bacterium]